MSKDPAKAARLQEEAAVVQGFVGLFQNKLDQIRRSPLPFTLKEEEKKQLYAFNNSGLWQGLATGVVSLIVLRYSRAALYRRLNTLQEERRFFTSPRQSQPPGQSTSTTPHVQSSPFQEAAGGASTPAPPGVNLIASDKSASTVWNVVGWMVDGLVSLSVAGAASLYFTDTKAIIKGLADLPLVEGGSQVADEFCPLVLQELYILHQQQASEQLQKAQASATPQPNFLVEESKEASQVVDDGALEEPNEINAALEWRGHPVQSIYLAAILQFGENCKTMGRLQGKPWSSPSEKDDEFFDAE